MIKVVDARESTPVYGVGTLVRHRRYGYRGVIVAVDTSCRAPDSWYSSNQTRPRRDQPWYHVLVHDSPQATYAAEENLDVDPSNAPIHHPLLDEFFVRFVGDRYERSSTRWPGW